MHRIFRVKAYEKEHGPHFNEEYARKNEPVRVENLAGTGIYLLHYNKYTNQVFLVSGGYKATATPSA